MDLLIQNIIKYGKKSIKYSVPVYTYEPQLKEYSRDLLTEPLAKLLPSPLRTSTFIVTEDDVCFRSAPGLFSTVLGILQKGEHLSVGTMDLDNQVTKDSYVWMSCQHQLTHQYGWVAVDYVKSTEDQ